MELRHFRYFIALAEEMNFGRAARRLHITQPPLSRQIRELETELGVALLERRDRRFSLTAAGATFEAEARRILEAVEAAREATRAASVGEGALRIGYVGSLMHSFLPELLGYIQARVPGPRIELAELSSEAQARAIAAGQIDLGLLRDWAAAEGLRYEPLGEESLAVIHPEGMRGRTGGAPVLEDLSRQPYVALAASAAPGIGGLVEAACRTAGFAPAVAFECGQVSSALRLVMAGLGWTIVPTFALGGMDLHGVGRFSLPVRIRFGVAVREGEVPARTLAVMTACRRFAARHLTEGH